MLVTWPGASDPGWAAVPLLPMRILRTSAAAAVKAGNRTYTLTLLVVAVAIGASVGAIVRPGTRCAGGVADLSLEGAASQGEGTLGPSGPGVSGHQPGASST